MYHYRATINRIGVSRSLDEAQNRKCVFWDTVIWPLSVVILYYLLLNLMFLYKNHGKYNIMTAWDNGFLFICHHTACYILKWINHGLAIKIFIMLVETKNNYVGSHQKIEY